MAYGDNLAKRLVARIATSAHSLIVHFPAARPSVSGNTVSGPTVNPLTGGIVTPTLQAVVPAPALPAVTMQCLWYANVRTDDLKRQRISEGPKGWNSEVDSLAQVVATDAVQGSGTIFDSCDYVEHEGKHYAVAGVTAMSAGFATTHSYYVWLKGRVDQ
jgi:hypothetical protein